MNKTLIKICGIKTPEMASLAVLAGANYIGLIFHPSSKRYVEIAQASQITKATLEAGATPVAVFVDHSASDMLQICNATGITTVQLHGSTARQQHHLLPAHFTKIYVLSVNEHGLINPDLEEGLPACDPTQDFILLDNEQAGSGKAFPRDKFQYQAEFRWFLAGGLTPSTVANAVAKLKPTGVDVSSGVENTQGEKEIEMIKEFIKNVKIGRYGQFGGAYLPELLVEPIRELTESWNQAKEDLEFERAFKDILKHYAGRPTALTEVSRFSKTIQGPRVFLKREDLLHTGAHKLNNALGQCLLAQRMGKKRIVAETGAGQHGVATAAACAYLGLNCVVYMGSEDMRRQSPNVARMRLMGAQVVPVTNGSATLKEAVSEAFRDWSASFSETYYCLGSALGPHPYPEMVAYFQSVIGEECQRQSLEQFKAAPDLVMACVGGGSNAIGIFSAFLSNPNVRLIGVEAGGHGNNIGEHAARFRALSQGVLHGCYTYILQDENGQIAQTASISAGLDYPGVGPQHADLFAQQRVDYVAASDDEAVAALKLLAKTEGIICALESAHALAHLIKIAPTLPKEYCVVVNLSGRGDKDLPQLMEREEVSL